MWLGLTDLAETGQRRDSWRFRATLLVLRYGWWSLLVLLIASYALEALGYPMAAGVLAIVTMFGYVFFAGAVFEAIVMLVREDRFVGDLADAHLVYGVVIAGLYFVPTLYGSIEGKMAADPTRSDLLIVRVARTGGQDLRLLVLSQGTAYAADLADGAKSKIKVHVFPVSELKVVMPRSAVLKAVAPAQTTPAPAESP